MKLSPGHGANAAALPPHPVVGRMEQRGDAAELQASLVARVFWATELGPTILGDAVAAVGEGKRSEGSPPSRSQRPPAYLGAGSPCGPGEKSVGFHRLSTEATGNRKFFPGRLGLGPESARRWGQGGSQGDGAPVNLRAAVQLSPRERLQAPVSPQVPTKCGFVLLWSLGVLTR